MPVTGTIEPGVYVDNDGRIFTVLAVFGRGRNRQVRLDRPRHGGAIGAQYMRVKFFRRAFTRKQT